MTDPTFRASVWIDELERGGTWLRTLLDSTSASQWRVHPAPGKWSLLEILGHLVDEEREDFRSRLVSTLEDPRRAWPPIDPEGWVVTRDYSSRDPHQLLAEFTEQRTRSVAELRERASARWQNVHEHPILGPLRAGDLLCAWVAHDHLHGQQIMRTRWQLLESATASYSPRYAMP